MPWPSDDTPNAHPKVSQPPGPDRALACPPPPPRAPGVDTGADLGYFLAGGSGLFSRRRTYLLTLPPSAPLTQFPRCPRTTLGAAGETPAPTWPSAPATTLHLHVVNCLAHPTLASEFIHSLSSLFTLLSLKSQFCPSMRNGVSTIHPFEPQPPLLLLRTLL